MYIGVFDNGEWFKTTFRIVYDMYIYVRLGQGSQFSEKWPKTPQNGPKWPRNQYNGVWFLYFQDDLAKSIGPSASD